MTRRKSKRTRKPAAPKAAPVTTETQPMTEPAATPDASPVTESAAAPAHPFADAAALDALTLETGPVAGDPAAPAPPVRMSADQSIAETAGVLTVVMGPAFAILAPNWNLKDSEVTQLAQAYAVVIEKYFPGGAQGFGPELAAAMLTIGILAPRINKPRKLEPLTTEPDAKP